MRPVPSLLQVKKYEFKKMIDGYMIDGYPVLGSLLAAFVVLKQSLLKYRIFGLKYRIDVEPLPEPDSPV